MGETARWSSRHGEKSLAMQKQSHVRPPHSQVVWVWLRSNGIVEEAEAVVTARNATELGSSWTCPYPHTGEVLYWYYGPPKRNDRESV